MRGFRSTGESCVDVLDFGTWSFSSLTWSHPHFGVLLLGMCLVKTKLLLVQLPFLYVNVDDNLVTFVKIWSTVGPLRVGLMTLSGMRRRRRRRKRGKLRGKNVTQLRPTLPVNKGWLKPGVQISVVCSTFYLCRNRPDRFWGPPSLLL